MTQMPKQRPALRDATVRIDKRTDDVLSDLARSAGMDKKQVLAESVEMMRRQRLLDSLCEGYRALRNDKQGWAEEQAERALWETASLNGLENE